MPPLPVEISRVLNVFAVLFTQPSWLNTQVLLVGALLCQGARRVTSVLRVMGLSQEKRFEKYHRVLNRARWNNLQAAKILLGLLLQLLPTDYPLLMPVDDTIERRQGKQIQAKGVYRDACRSSENQVITCFGLKWICLTLLVPLPWCSRVWALPVLTVLAPSKEANKAQGRAHRTSIDWTIVLVRVMSRWLKRSFVLIGDGGFACLRLGWACLKRQVTLIARLRLDAALYEFPAVPQAGQRGRHRQKGQRSSSLQQLSQDSAQPWQTKTISWYGGELTVVALLSGVNLWYSPGDKPLPIRWVLIKLPGKEQAEAFFSTDLALSPEQIITWFVLRWNIEVTFAETRAHLGVETQRQWSAKAIARTTPILMGLYSLVCVLGQELLKVQCLPILSTAWYHKKQEATFSDILAFVRRAIWAKKYFNDSSLGAEYIQIKPSQWESLLDQLIRAA